MEFKQIDAIVGELHGIASRWGQRVYEHVLESRPQEVLELGFWHGKSSCYIAAALHELGHGHLTTVDLEAAKGNKPNIEETLLKSGLASFVTVKHEPTSYTWFLKKEIEENTTDGKTIPKYDLAFIDGAHSWEVDGMAFFLVDKLLKNGGRILFDDYDWSFGTSEALKSTSAVLSMPADERDSPQVKLIFELLVKQHPSYGQFLVEQGNWAWATKLSSQEASGVRTETRVLSPKEVVKRILGRS